MLKTDIEPLPDTVRSALNASHDPDRVEQYFWQLRRTDPQIVNRLIPDRSVLDSLTTVFRLSRFLSEEVVRHPEWIWDLDPLDRVLTAAEFGQRLQQFLKSCTPPAPSALNLALFRRRELMRILVRDGKGRAGVDEITEEISNLADAILECALTDTLQREIARHGDPIHQGKPHEKAVISVLALGKLGGRELNYSSDIDLMFLYSGNGETSGEHRITNKEFFKKVANDVTNLLSTYTPAGVCYRVDLRLRPEGTLGDVCTPIEGTKEYYRTRARDWELQMLIKARVAAGDCELGESLLQFVHPLIYSTTLDFSTIEGVSATRERLREKLARRSLRRQQFDIKLARGGIRDIEFLAQCLQRLHGGRDSSLRKTGTLYALSSLLDSDLISQTEHEQLAEAYKFLRTLEHRLQFDEDKQTHTLPEEPSELQRLAARMPSEDGYPFQSGTELLAVLNQHLERVQVVYERIVHAQRPLYYSPAPLIETKPDGEAVKTPAGASAESSRARETKGALNAFRDSLAHNARYRELIDHPAVAEYIERIFGLTPFLSERLTRNPELISELYSAAALPNVRPAFEGIAAPLNDIDGLRRFYARQLFRILVGSVCKPDPVFYTLDRESGLTEFLIARSYRIALEQAIAYGKARADAHKPFSRPENEMMVVALGRLGMREFDIGSDADLLFIIPDSEGRRQQFWTRVAERMIHILSDYGPDGAPALLLDTRLRPNGREGMLVQTESAYVDYFSGKAEAWEGISYMKARALAGDIERATSFLTQLQQVDWRRYGQGGRSRQELRHMRMRLQREHAAVTPLKAGEGGYYDADFILMYLRLKGAGMFYRSLNTPERIDVVEKMGHLEREDAEFLLYATTFLRAVDHGCRVVVGRAEARLPSESSYREKLTKLVQRWTHREFTGASLEDELFEIQRKLRRLFDSVFL